MKKWLVVLVVFGCGTNAPSRPVVRPSCGELGAREQPLVVDWTGPERTALAAAMTRGIVAVSYTCGALHVVDRCSARGHYAFVATTPRSQSIRLETADEAIANLPKTGAAWTHAFDVPLAIAGQQATIHKHVERAELEGSCDHVTHFVESVDVAADKTPLRLHLTAIDSDDGRTGGAVPDAPCGADRVWRDGKCTMRSQQPHQCHLGSYDDCNEQCTRGNAGSCTTLGVILAAGMNVPKDEPRAVEVLQKACKLGDPLGCRHTADMLASGEALTRDEPRAVAMFDQLCDGGLGTACSYLGVLVEMGHGTTVDHERATALFQRSCDAGYARGCNNLASRFLVNSTDVAPAIAILEDACAAGDTPSCNGLAGMLMLGGAAPDLSRALKLFERACSAGQNEACANLGTVLLRGVGGVAKDEARGLKLLHDACAAGVENGCQLLASYDLETSATSGQIDQSLLTKQKACAQGDAASCLVLAHVLTIFEGQCTSGSQVGCANEGQLLVEGMGGAKNEAKARDLFQHSCDAKIEAACTGVSIMMLRGDGGPADPRAALAILRAGCTGKAVQRCATLGNALAQGVGVPAEPKRALETFELGCTGGNAESCEDAGLTLYNLDDHANALASFERACKLGRTESCTKRDQLKARDKRLVLVRRLRARTGAELRELLAQEPGRLLVDVFDQ